MFRLDDETFAEAKRILRDLIRIDTTNPPGNEREAAAYLEKQLRGDGIESTILEPAPHRANLVARLKGDGSQRPLLLGCHLDVVEANAENWTHPPFEAVEADGFIWGRGAIDMKGFAAMAFAVFRLLKRNGVNLKRDVIFAAVADEEQACEFGSRYLVDHHPDLIRAEYVLNEVGGFNITVRGRAYRLVQVAERGIVQLRIHVRGEPGHSAKPCPNSAVAKAGEVLQKLGKSRFPHHVSDSARNFILALGRNANPVARLVSTGLTKPRLGRFLLHHVVPPGRDRDSLQANLANTANPTIVRAGSKLNVVPGEVVIDVDGRISPASSADELVREIAEAIGPEHAIEVVHSEPAAEFSAKTEVYRQIVEVMREHDPETEVVPYQVYAATDSRNYARLGATCYGFYPLQMPADVDFPDLFHGVDERIPVEGFRFGIQALYDLVTRVVT